MVGLILLHCALSLMPASFTPSGQSFLKDDEAEWAKRLQLSPSYVHQIVQAAGYSPEDPVRIENLDISHLRRHSHVLLVTAAGNGHCLTLTVLARKGETVKAVWELSETPDGGGFCHDGARTGDFQAHAMPDGSIVVDVPKDKAGHYVLKESRLVYTWNGERYAPSGPAATRK